MIKMKVPSVMYKFVYIIASLLITSITSLMIFYKFPLLVSKNSILKFMTSDIDLSISSFHHFLFWAYFKAILRPYNVTV